MICAQLFKCPKWSHLEIDCFHSSSPGGCWMLPPLPNSSNSWSPGWSWLQTGDQRGDSWSARHRRRHPSLRQTHFGQAPTTASLSISLSLYLPPSLPWRWTSSATARWGLKEFRPTDKCWRVGMVTMRQKTLIGFNWKSIMGLIATPPLSPTHGICYLGPSLSGWPRREISEWLARLWCVKLH